MIRAAVFDLDGTLADLSHRVHFVDGSFGGPPDWMKFFQGLSEDTPKPDIVMLLRELSEHSAILISSGRPEHCRAETEAWLKVHDISYAEMYLRADEDEGHDTDVKRVHLAQMRADGFAPWLVIDDRKSVVKMWREEGLTCLQCAPGDF